MKAGSCIDVKHWSTWFPIPEYTDKVVPYQGGKEEDKMRWIEGMWHCRNMSWLCKMSLKGRIQLNRTIKKSLTGFDNQSTGLIFTIKILVMERNCWIHSADKTVLQLRPEASDYEWETPVHGLISCTQL